MVHTFDVITDMLKRVITTLAVAFVGFLLVLLVKIDTTDQDIISLNSRVDTVSDDLEGLKFVLQGTNEPLVGASTLFAQNASVQLNLEVRGSYASASFFMGSAFSGVPGAECSDAGDTLNWNAGVFTCGSDGGGITFGTDNQIPFTNSGGTDFDYSANLTFDGSLLDLAGFASVSQNLEVGNASGEGIKIGNAGVFISDDEDGALTFLGMGDGNDENLIMNLDDTSGRVVFTTTTALNGWTFTNMSLDSGFAGAYSLVGASQDINNPTYRFGNDTNTGVWNPGNAGTIGFISDGTNVASISLNLLRLSGSASVSTNFEAVGYASASLYRGLAFGSPNIDCNDATDQLLWSAGIFTCETLASNDITSLGALSIDSGVTWTTTGQLTVGDGGDRVDFSTAGWDIADSVMTGMTISTNNVTGTWTTTGNLTIGDGGDDVIINSDTWDVSSLGAMTGVTGIVSTGLIDFGGADLEIPNGTPTLNSVGEIGGKTASATSGAFLRVYDGTAERVHQSRTCFGLDYGTPTTKDHISIWNAFDPFTIHSVYMTASGSNAVGWQIRHGKTVATLTDLFSANKQGSTTFDKLTTPYTSFSDATIADGERVDFVISSASATIDNIFVRVCGYYDPI